MDRSSAAAVKSGMALSDDETLEDLLAEAMPLARADLDEAEVRSLIDSIENSVGINTLAAIDLAARNRNESLSDLETCARAMIVSLRIFQTCLAAYKLNLVPDGGDGDGWMH